MEKSVKNLNCDFDDIPLLTTKIFGYFSINIPLKAFFKQPFYLIF